VIVSHSKKAIFIHFEKCGGTSVESAIQPYLDFKDIIIGSTEYGEATQEFLFQRYGVSKVKRDMLWKHSTARQIHKHVGKNDWDEYTKVSVVRDPVQLAKSLFSFSEKVLSYHAKIDYDYWNELVRKGNFPRTWPYDEGYIRSYITSHVYRTKFHGFVSNMIFNDYDCFSPFTERLMPSFFQKDFGTVIDLSQLNDRWKDISKIFGAQGSEIGGLNASKSPSINVKDETVDIIKKRFAVDYEVLPQYTGVNWN